MTDKLKAILEGMGGEGVIITESCVEFVYDGKNVEIVGDLNMWDNPILGIDITEAGE